MVLEYIKVFIVGGIICLIAQIMMDYFKKCKHHMLWSHMLV